MFAKKTKRNYRIAVWSAVVVCLCILIVYFAWPQTPEEPAGSGMNPDYNPSAAASSENHSPVTVIEEYLDETETDENLPETEKEEKSISEPQNPYYLVKRAGTEIAVFFCDTNGNMVQLETTEILYEMLGPEDQKLFDQGVKIESQEELSVLLQDFEG